MSENFFASAAGPSYPNHFFFIAGSSGGVADNPENIRSRKEDGKRFKSWGCDALGDDVFVFVKDADGNLTKHSTCFEFPTVGEQLTDAGVDWAFYSAVPGQPGYFWNAYNGICNVFHTDLWHQHVRPVDRLLDDIDANALPAVTWVTPRFQLSDHPPFSTGHAHNWVTEIVNKVMRSDHVGAHGDLPHVGRMGRLLRPDRPSGRGPVGLGIRVPLLTISPYTRRGVIDDERGEFSTPLRFISDNWGLEPLTDRIRNTHNFEHVFNFWAEAEAAEARPREGADATRTPELGLPERHYTGWEPGTVPVEDAL